MVRLLAACAVLVGAWAEAAVTTATARTESLRADLDTLRADAPGTIPESLQVKLVWPGFEEPGSNHSWKAFRFHPGPKSQCGTFAITEFAVLRRFGSELEVPSTERYYVSFDCGLEHNVSDHIAVGGSVFGGLDNSDRTQVGLRLRSRLWLSQSMSVDVAPGLVLGGKEEKMADFLPPGPILRVAVNPSASVGIVYQTFETRRQKSYGVVSERASYVGAQLASRPGVAGAGAALIAAALVVMIALSNWN